MVEEFRDCFVGEKGYDALKKFMKSGNEVCVELSKCLQERNDYEIAYVKNCQKTSNTLEKLARKANGSLGQGLMTLSMQIQKESEAHGDLAATLLNDIAIPMKNFADTQVKDRKSIEETLAGKFKEWNAEKEIDLKRRSRHFETSKQIEMLHVRMSELSKAPKSSKESAKGGKSSLVSCVLPGGRHSRCSEQLETNIQKAEEELEKTDRKYHTSTRAVEIARQACDTQMCRSCDELQKMELDRITAMEKFIALYTNSMQSLSETMREVSQNLFAVRIMPRDDIITAARSSIQTTEIEISLYDIYAETAPNGFGEHRQILSLMRWMEMLRRDVEIQRQTVNASLPSRSSLSRKSVKDTSPDDDRGSGDGAMCAKSSHRKSDIVVKTTDRSQDDDESSSSNDDDGGMHHTKSKKRADKKNQGGEKFSSEQFIDRHGAQLLLCLFEASLYKIEKAYNHLKNLPEPRYDQVQRLTYNTNDKGIPITVIRVPFQPSTHTPPSAPPATHYFAAAMPIVPLSAAQPPAPYSMQQQAPMSYSMQQQAPVSYPILQQASGPYPVQQQAPASYLMQQQPTPVGRAVINDQSERRVPDNQMVTSAPVHSSRMTRSADYPPQKQDQHVQAIFPYQAQRKDELSFDAGEIILLLQRRSDGWCQGICNDKGGLFPANYVKDV